MKVRAQFALVFNLDKCIGCHTCTVTCKNFWTNRKGQEYAYWNNVESKPGVGYPKQWENQDRWQGGWEKKNGKLKLRQGGRAKELSRIFANPNMPEIGDYYEPFTFDYKRLVNAPLSEAAPTARPVSQIDGKKMEKINWGPNWEDDLAGEFESRAQDSNFEGVEKRVYAAFERTFHFYLPRMCNHCLNPSCLASCPSGAIYKREEDGLVLIDQNRCRGWRMCVSACPYKKVYFNWDSGKSEKCIGCYPRIESGLPTACSETCVGRIRYNGILLYDADRILDAASTDEEQELYKSHLDLFLDPNDPEVIRAAKEEGIPDDWIEAAQNSPIYKLAIDWRLAFPLHPEFRTLPMVWYVPPLSPVKTEIEQGNIAANEEDGILPDIERLRIPVQYLANLLTAGDPAPVVGALRKLFAVRHFMRVRQVEGVDFPDILEAAGLTLSDAEQIHRYLAIANYEDRFVVPTSHAETALEDPYAYQGQLGFGFGNGSAGGMNPLSLFPKRNTRSVEGREDSHIPKKKRGAS